MFPIISLLVSYCKNNGIKANMYLQQTSADVVFSARKQTDAPVQETL